jgi:GntR family transcriptional regulator, transcriptional repressor for pyruvate dehydrogenase complex
MDQLQPVKTITVFEAVFDQLSALLSSDAFAPGDRLPSERELAAQLHVSRPMVREAMKALRMLGRVEVRGRSTYVKGPQAPPAADAPQLVLPLAEVELLEIHEFREAVESQVAALAAERATARDAEALARIFALMQQEFAHDVEAFFAAERQFHRALAQAAANRLLLAAHAQIHEHELLQPHLYPAALHGAAVEGALEHTLDAHRKILEAVRQRDGARARRLMREHLAHLRQYIILGGLTPAPAEEQAVP